ncbi:hypothetical protein H6796_01680 [Candidatus Nomurabacteria bacterium]|nr:hypothetical protein [Candidatus Nomurabacteria bacterium]
MLKASEIVQNLKSSNWQSIMLHSKPGVDLKSIADSVASSERYIAPTLRTKASTIPQISIDAIRELRQEVKTTANHDIVIQDADMMSLAAQNAFLKILEEPNKYTRFILLTHSPDELLPTVRSRIEMIYVPPASKHESEMLMSKHKIFDEKTRSQLMYLAEGRLDELRRLASDEKYRTQRFDEARTTRELLSANPYERLAIISKLNLQRKPALDLLESMQSILVKQPNVKNLQLSERLEDAYVAIAGNGNIKLQLMRSMVY